MHKQSLRVWAAVGLGLASISGALMVAQAQNARTRVVWFVGIGTGGQPAQIDAEKAAVARFNKAQDKIDLVLEVVDYNQAKDNLSARIAAGNAPDFVGPVGNEGAAQFKGQWLDLDGLVAKYKPDLRGVDDALVKFYKESQEGTGLPYAVYPSFLFYNKQLFDEAKLPYPPQKFGEKYQGRTWDWNALRSVAMKLTLDANGADATEKDFDPKKIINYGFVNQWNTSIQGMGTTFGAGSLIDKNGKAQIPAQWGAALRYYQKAIWKDHFMPDQDAMNSDLLGKGNVINSGNVAMGYSHLWYSCCIDAPGTGKLKNWGVAVIPSYNGKYTAKLHADTFRIMKSSKNQDAAFQAMWWLMQQPDLLKTYGAFPADERLQDDFIAETNRKYAPVKINWQVIRDSLKYVDTPSHEAFVPNYIKVGDILNKLSTKIFAQPNVDLTKEISTTRSEVQRAFDEKK